MGEPEPIRCAWEGCTDERPFDPDWKCPLDWGLIEWIAPGADTIAGQAFLCPVHYPYAICFENLRQT